MAHLFQDHTEVRKTEIQFNLLGGFHCQLERRTNGREENHLNLSKVCFHLLRGNLLGEYLLFELFHQSPSMVDGLSPGGGCHSEESPHLLQYSQNWIGDGSKNSRPLNLLLSFCTVTTSKSILRTTGL